MSEELINTIVLQAPNFIGYTLLAVILLYVIRLQQKLIMTLVEKWERCEDDNDKVSILSSHQAVNKAD